MTGAQDSKVLALRVEDSVQRDDSVPRDDSEDEDQKVSQILQAVCFKVKQEDQAETNQQEDLQTVAEHGEPHSTVSELNRAFLQDSQCEEKAEVGEDVLPSGKQQSFFHLILVP